MNDWRKPCEHRRYDDHATFEGKVVSWASADELEIAGRVVGDCPGGSPVTAADLEGEKKWWCEYLKKFSDPSECNEGFGCHWVLLIPIPEAQPVTEGM